MFLEISQKLQENTCKKETLAQVFSCEFGKISKNTFFTEPLPVTASELSLIFLPAKFVVVFVLFALTFSTFA